MEKLTQALNDVCDKFGINCRPPSGKRYRKVTPASLTGGEVYKVYFEQKIEDVNKPISENPLWDLASPAKRDACEFMVYLRGRFASVKLMGGSVCGASFELGV